MRVVCESHDARRPEESLALEDLVFSPKLVTALLRRAQHREAHPERRQAGGDLGVGQLLDARWRAESHCDEKSGILSEKS